MIKKLVYIILFTAVPILAQNNDTPDMNYWIGGKMKFNYSFNLNTTGAGAGSGTFGGVISPSLRNGAASLFSNPAELGLMNYKEIIIDTKPPFSPTYFGLTKDDIIPADEIKSQTDEILEDTATFIFNPSNLRRDTEVEEADILHTGGFSSFALGIPVYDKFTAALGLTYPVDLDLKMLVAGINTSLTTEKRVGNNTTEIDMLLRTNVNMDMSVKMNHLSFGLGYSFFDYEDERQLSAGFSVNRYSARTNVNNLIFTDGMMVLNSSNEYYFNDPNDPNLDFEDGETNKLFWHYKGNYQAAEWGFKFGLYYNPGKISDVLKNLRFSFVYDNVPEITLTDEDAFSESYQPKFMTGKFTGEDDEALDIVVDSIDLAKPNLTVSTYNDFSSTVNLNMASSLNLGMDVQLGEHLLAYNFTKYFGETSYGFDKYRLGFKPNFGVRFGLDLKFPDDLNDNGGWSLVLIPYRLLFLDIDGIILQIFKKSTQYSNPHYRVGGGWMFGDAVVNGLEPDQQTDLEDALSMGLPTGFTLGREYTILNNIRIGVMVFSYPDFLLRYSVSYRID